MGEWPVFTTAFLFAVAAEDVNGVIGWSNAMAGDTPVNATVKISIWIFMVFMK